MEHGSTINSTASNPSAMPTGAQGMYGIGPVPAPTSKQVIFIRVRVSQNTAYMVQRRRRTVGLQRSACLSDVCLDVGQAPGVRLLQGCHAGFVRLLQRNRGGPPTRALPSLCYERGARPQNSTPRRVSCSHARPNARNTANHRLTRHCTGGTAYLRLPQSFAEACERLSVRSDCELCVRMARRVGQ